MILRHAKSSWDDPDLSDFDRPLNARGCKAAPFMGRLIAERGYLPELIVSSPAKRAAETAALVRENAGISAETQFDERIYEASPQALRQVVSETPETVTSLMIIGHNPGMEGFVRFLTGELLPMPTAALSIIDLDIEKWEGLTSNCGRLLRMIKPKDEMLLAKTGK
jgi:phosphohistidine phosphatase